MKNFILLFTLSIGMHLTSASQTLTATPNVIAYGEVCVGTTSIKSFNLTGSNLKSTVTINPKQGMSFSVDNNLFYSTLNITPINGSVSKTVYAKAVPLGAISYSGSIKISSGTTLSIYVTTSGQGIVAPLSVITLSPPTALVCYNTIQPIEATTVGGVYNSKTVNSDAQLNLIIPDNDPAGLVNSLNITDMPDNAVVTGISIKFLLTHNSDMDLTINLKAPNGQILNLVNKQGGAGSNFTNTEINSTSTVSFASGKPPYVKTYAPDAVIGVGAENFVSIADNFDDLYNKANGVWEFIVNDSKPYNEGKLHRWTIVLSYAVYPKLTWSNTSELYIDPTNLIPYTEGTNSSMVYSKPTQNQAYTVTAVNSYGCVTTATATVSIAPLKWLGAISSDWDFPGNWCGLIPTSTNNISIASTAKNQPVINEGTNALINNITVENGAVLTIKGSLKVSGALISPGTTNAANGTVEMAGNQAQVIEAKIFANNAIKNLTINNAAGVTLKGTLNLTGVLNPLRGIFTTNDFLTLKSTVEGTASVAKGNAAGNYITGNVMVERFLNINTQNGNRTGRAWRLLTSPVAGNISINDAWQEGMVSSNATNYPTSNTSRQTTPPAGYGTRITGQQQGSFTNASRNGYDYWDAISNASSSIRHYKPGKTIGAFVNLEVKNDGNIDYSINTKTRSINDEQGYLVYVRGDRNYYNTTPFGETTTLRVKGVLKQGVQKATVNGSNTASHTLIGNPYASPLNFETVYTANQTVIQPRFWFWNSNISSYGSYTLVLRTAKNAFTTVPFQDIENLQYLQSSQAFFVEPATTTDATITINETDKALPTSTISVFATNNNAPTVQDQFSKTTAKGEPRLFGNLYLQNSNDSIVLADGFLIRMNNTFNINIDRNDIGKPVNFYENLGIQKDSNVYMVEARPMPSLAKDTITLKLWNVSMRKYVLKFRAEYIDATRFDAYLSDAYTKTFTKIDLTQSYTDYAFIVNAEAESYNVNRFKIVLGRIKRVQQNTANKVANDTEIVNRETLSAISVYPNPANSGVATVTVKDLNTGKYEVSVVNNFGQLVSKVSVDHAGGDLINKIKINNNWKPGLYNVQVRAEKGMAAKSISLLIN